MTEEKLKNYFKLRSVIRSMMNEIESLHDTRHAITAINPYISGSHKSPVEHAIRKIITRENNLVKAIEEYAALGEEIEEWLQNVVTDPTTNAIIRQRFLLGKSWDATGKAIYNTAYAGETCRIWYGRHKSQYFEEE